MSDLSKLHEAATPAPWGDKALPTDPLYGGYEDVVFEDSEGNTLVSYVDDEGILNDADIHLIVKLRSDYASGALIDPTCHHYEGIKCFHTKDCSIDKKRERCPFDDHQSGTLVEAPTCEVCGGSGDGKPFNEVFMDGKSPRKSPCIHCRGTGYEPMVPLSKFGNAEYHALAGLMDGKTPNDEIIRRLRAESVPLGSVEALVAAAWAVRNSYHWRDDALMDALYAALDALPEETA